MIVNIWPCPVSPKRYSFSVATQRGGVMLQNEFEGSSYLSGNFETLDEALKAGKTCALEN